MRAVRPGVLVFVALTVAAALAFITFRWWPFAPREPELPAHWEAVVSTVADRTSVGAEPFGIAAAADGTLYVSDSGAAHRIRRIAPDGSVSMTGGATFGFADGVGEAARFNTPSGLAIGPDGSVYVADTGNNAIRRITADGAVTTLAGDGIAGYLDGPGSAARFNGPVGVAVDSAGRVMVADTYNDRIRAIEPDGAVITIAGGRPGRQDGQVADALFNTPAGVAVDAHRNIYVADTGNDSVRVISPAGDVTTMWSLPQEGLFRPAGIAVGSAGAVYVCDEGGRVIELTPAGGARVIAGSRPGFADGSGAGARFRALSALAVLGPGRLVVVDRRNGAIRSVVARSRLTFREPGPPSHAAFARASLPPAPSLWPFVPFEGPHEITGTLGEPRGAQSDRLHAGLDIHAPEGTTVHAVRAGVVSDLVAASAFGTLTESLRVGTLTYVHMRVGRERGNQAFDDPRFVSSVDDEGKLMLVRVKRGARFRAGEPVGTVNAFNHVHLNVGWPAEEVNPLMPGLVQFDDTIGPTIARGGIRLFREDGQRLTARRNRRLLVSGRVRIVVDAWDQVDGNARRRRLGLYRLGYQILRRDGTPAPGFEQPRETMRFDRLAPEPEAARLIYASGSGIPEFGTRSTHFLYVVTNTFRDGVATPGIWDADALTPGDYVLRVLAADVRGNEATVNRDVPITIETIADGR